MNETTQRKAPTLLLWLVKNRSVSEENPILSWFGDKNDAWDHLIDVRNALNNTDDATRHGWTKDDKLTTPTRVVIPYTRKGIIDLLNTYAAFDTTSLVDAEDTNTRISSLRQTSQIVTE